MRILVPTGSYYPAEIGGPSNTIYWLNRGLHQSDWDVTVVTTDYKVQNVAVNTWNTSDHGKVRYCNTRYMFLPINAFWHTIIQIKNTEIVHLNSLFYPLSFTTALAARLLSKPVVWSPRGELYGFALGVSKSRLKNTILAAIKLLFANKFTFHATNLEEEQLIKKHFGEQTKTFVLPNYMVLPQKVERDSEAEAYLLFVGRIHPIKGLDLLLNALAKSIRFGQSNFKLKIAGTGEKAYELSLKHKITKLNLQDKIEFLGHVSGADKEQIYANAYILILPSHSENFGNVVIESLAQGTPVIASKGTPWEILGKTQSGFWTATDKYSLAQTLDLALGLNTLLYQSYRANAYNLATNEYNIFRNVDKWITEYKKCMQQ